MSLAVAAAIASGGTAMAADSGDELELSEVVVTGSRVIREGMTSPTPITEELEHHRQRAAAWHALA